MTNIDDDLEGLPSGVQVIEAPRVQRQVSSVWPTQAGLLSSKQL